MIIINHNDNRHGCPHDFLGVSKLGGLETKVPSEVQGSSRDGDLGAKHASIIRLLSVLL